MKITGIYKITNLINGKSYIGQSADIKRRWRNHKSCCTNTNNRQHNNELYLDMYKYGLDNFNFEILEECSKEQLLEREEYWINECKTYEFGYNKTHGGSWGIPSKLNDQDIETITILLYTTSLDNKEIASKFCVSENIISGINTGYYWNRKEIKYPIRPNFSNGGLEKKERHKKCPLCGKQILASSNYCFDCNGIINRKVDRPTKEVLYDELKEAEGSFTRVARKYNVRDNTIRKWCKKYKLPSHTRDYIK